MDEVRKLVAGYLNRSGETITAFALRAGVRRELVSQFINSTYENTPSFDIVCRLAHAAGGEIKVVRARD